MKTLAFGTNTSGPLRIGSRKIARFRAGDGSAQNFAANIMGPVKSFFEEFASKNKLFEIFQTLSKTYEEEVQS